MDTSKSFKDPFDNTDLEAGITLIMSGFTKPGWYEMEQHATLKLYLGLMNSTSFSVMHTISHLVDELHTKDADGITKFTTEIDALAMKILDQLNGHDKIISVVALVSTLLSLLIQMAGDEKWKQEIASVVIASIRKEIAKNTADEHRN